VGGGCLVAGVRVGGGGGGGELSFEQGVGPRFGNPVRKQADVDRLETDCLDKLQYVVDAIRVIQERLAGRIPLIGFAGAPFTILSYLVEGGSSKDFKRTNLMLNIELALAHQLLQKIADVTINYLNMQIDAGVNAVQLFDSWALALSWNDYREFAHYYNKYILDNIKRTVPVISFCKGSSVFAPIMAEANPDVV